MIRSASFVRSAFYEASQPPPYETYCLEWVVIRRH